MHHTKTASLPDNLQSLLEQLDRENYPHLESLCRKVHSCIVTVQINDIHDAARTYTSLCMKLQEYVHQYVRMQRLVTVPYISDLIEKEDVGHDCGVCGGGCSIRHSAHIADIRTAHDQITEVLTWIDDAGTQVRKAGGAPDGCDALHGSVLLLHAALAELFAIEESAMIPMMMTLQENIGAHA